MSKHLEKEREENLSDVDVSGSYSDDDDEDLDEDVDKQFQESVIKYVKLDDIIRKREAEIKDLKNQRKPCEAIILNYLDTINETVIDITMGKLRKNKSETKSPLNKDIIKEAITEKIQDPAVVEQLLNRMDELRPMKTNVNLKRTCTRGPAKNKKK